MPSDDEWLLPEVTVIKHMLDRCDDVRNARRWTDRGQKRCTDSMTCWRDARRSGTLDIAAGAGVTSWYLR
jgi:hypothetical protein